MKNHRINIDNFKIEKVVKNTVLQMIMQIEEKLQINEKLSPKERLSMVSCGEKRNAFVEKIIKIAKQNLQLLPRTFNLNEMGYVIISRVFELQFVCMIQGLCLLLAQLIARIKDLCFLKFVYCI